MHEIEYTPPPLPCVAPSVAPRPLHGCPVCPPSLVKGTDFYMTSLNAQAVIDEWNNGINLVDILEIMVPQVWLSVTKHKSEGFPFLGVPLLFWNEYLRLPVGAMMS